MHKIRSALAAGLMAVMLTASACTASLGTPPPQLPAQVQTISRAALNFAFSSFDAALYAFDFAMDLKKPAPGSDQAKAIAAAGRKVLSFLNAAEAARRAGNAASYEEAMTQAHAALSQFRSLLGIAGARADLAPLAQPVDREAILARAA